MPGNLTKQKLIYLPFWLFVTTVCLSATAEPLDKSKYIGIDEIQPGMHAYCLTAYKGTKIEKFDLDVLSIVRSFEPGKDAILVQSTDERFIHTGPIAGCSGSPVYIDGRLAGALAFGWSFSKDPLYGVTPIAEMLRVGRTTAQTPDRYRLGIDFSKPIDFARICQKAASVQPATRSSLGAATALRCPLITSHLPEQVRQHLNTAVEPFGLLAVSGVGAGSVVGLQTADTQTSPGQHQDAGQITLQQGSCLAIPLVTGDMEMTVIGTVTDVRGNTVYGFGHSFLGYGAVDLPMATGYVHTVVSTVRRSFKLATAVKTIGALTADESTAVRGRIGAKAKMIPLTIKVKRYNDTEQRQYNCQIVNNRLLTPSLLRSAVDGAVLMLGDLPEENKIEYKVSIGLKNAPPITFENVSTNRGLFELIQESIGSVTLLMNNPYKEVELKSLDFSITVTRRNIASHIWSVELSDSKVKPGRKIHLDVVLESFRAEKKKYPFVLEIPQSVKPGSYELTVCGAGAYEKFLRKNAPHKFAFENLRTLVEATNNLLAIGRDRLYCTLTLPAAGVAVERAELPDLPATRAMVMQDTKRTLEIRPYQHWLQKSLKVDTVVLDKKVITITVQQ